jgi:hypothetical protein
MTGTGRLFMDPQGGVGEPPDLLNMANNDLANSKLINLRQ